ncbi:MAG: multicopper oxidase domain-containing protein [Gemmatimonadaceae bacterium]
MVDDRSALLQQISCSRDGIVKVRPGALGHLPAKRLPVGATLYRAGVMKEGHVLQSGGGGIFAGALIVDSARVDPRERVLVIYGWVNLIDTARFIQSINGRMWPATERMSANVGDTLRWQLVNATAIEHPMHLHGFYFHVASHGDITGDTIIASPERELAVTENLRNWGVASIAWVPTRGGDWLFHCHKSDHMSATQTAALRGLPPGPPPVHTNGAEHIQHDMGGLVLGVSVRGDPRADVATTTAPSRRLRLEITERPKFYHGIATAYAFRLASDSRNAGTNGVEGIPGPLFALERGEPVEVAIINRLKTASTVHWHGIELESYYDGVAGWSGVPGSLAPILAPSDSFVARFTPPRSGTFMYHAHVNESTQLTSGLYAPIVVTDNGRVPANDHVILFSQNGPDDLAKDAVNGKDIPDTLRLHASVPKRLRLINITANDDVSGDLMSGKTVAMWRRVAKDGASLPLARQREDSARFHFGPGEILDVRVTLARGLHRLHIRAFTDFDIPVLVK